MKKLIFGTLSAGALAFTGAYLYRQTQMLKQICFSIAGIQFAEFNFSRIRINISLLIKNKSQFAIKLKEQDLNIYVNRELVGRVQSDLNQAIAPSQTTLVSVPVQFDPSNVFRALLENITDILNNRQALLITVNGHFKASTGLVLTSRVPVNIEKTVGQIISEQGTGC